MSTSSSINLFVVDDNSNANAAANKTMYLSKRRKLNSGSVVTIDFSLENNVNNASPELIHRSHSDSFLEMSNTNNQQQQQESINDSIQHQEKQKQQKEKEMNNNVTINTNTNTTSTTNGGVGANTIIRSFRENPIFIPNSRNMNQLKTNNTNNSHSTITATSPLTHATNKKQSKSAANNAQQHLTQQQQQEILQKQLKAEREAEEKHGIMLRQTENSYLRLQNQVLNQKLQKLQQISEESEDTIDDLKMLPQKVRSQLEMLRKLHTTQVKKLTNNIQQLETRHRTDAERIDLLEQMKLLYEQAIARYQNNKNQQQLDSSQIDINDPAALLIAVREKNRELELENIDLRTQVSKFRSQLEDVLQQRDLALAQLRNFVQQPEENVLPMFNDSERIKILEEKLVKAYIDLQKAREDLENPLNQKS